MTDRYAVRKSENGCGVWDCAVNGWVGPRDLDEVDALRRASSLNVKITGQGLGGPRAHRTVDPPKPVIVAFDGGRQLEGFIDAWVRDAGLWWGHITLGKRDGWYPAFALRQA